MASATTTQSLYQQYETEFSTSRRLSEQARQIFPDGVTHDMRYLQPFPVYIDRAQGAHKWDVDGHKLIDYFSGHGALLLGHSHPEIVAAVQQQMTRGTHPGACHELEIDWGQWVQRLVPSAEKVRFVSSGTEATMMALRLARLFTGKPKVLKFTGHFHGWNDFVTPAANPPYDDLSVPGVTEPVRMNTVVISPNDADAVERTLETQPDIGCVILEPTGSHMGSVPIRGDFLSALRDITTRLDRLLIFDEVVTGFRVHPGGAQAHYGVNPDLTSLAKVLAGGLPGGCVTGRADILAHLEFHPTRPKMKHPGTFNANPLSAAAGTTALRLVSTGKPTKHANDLAALLKQKLNALFAAQNVDWVAYGEFSIFRMLTHYDGPRPDSDDFIPYDGDASKIDCLKDRGLTHAFRIGMLLNGVDLPGFGGILTAMHTEEDIAHTVKAVENTIGLLKNDGLI